MYIQICYRHSHTIEPVLIRRIENICFTNNRAFIQSMIILNQNLSIRNILLVRMSDLNRFLYMTMFIVVFGGCQSTDSLDTDAILRINRQMRTQFQQEQHADLAALFTDSIQLVMPGHYQAGGKPMVLAYWNRYLNPIDLTINHLKFYSDTTEILSDADVASRLKSVLSSHTQVHNPQTQSVYQWVDWQVEYESEDGVIRLEAHPTLLLWVDDLDTGWRINWMAQF